MSPRPDNRETVKAISTEFWPGWAKAKRVFGLWSKPKPAPTLVTDGFDALLWVPRGNATRCSPSPMVNWSVFWEGVFSIRHFEWRTLIMSRCILKFCIEHFECSTTRKSNLMLIPHQWPTFVYFVFVCILYLVFWVLHKEIQSGHRAPMMTNHVFYIWKSSSLTSKGFLVQIGDQAKPGECH